MWSVNKQSAQWPSAAIVGAILGRLNLLTLLSSFLFCPIQYETFSRTPEWRFAMGMHRVGRAGGRVWCCLLLFGPTHCHSSSLGECRGDQAASRRPSFFPCSSGRPAGCLATLGGVPSADSLSACWCTTVSVRGAGCDPTDHSGNTHLCSSDAILYGIHNIRWRCGSAEPKGPPVAAIDRLTNPRESP